MCSARASLEHEFLFCELRVRMGSLWLQVYSPRIDPSATSRFIWQNISARKSELNLSSTVVFCHSLAATAPLMTGISIAFLPDSWIRSMVSKVGKDFIFNFICFGICKVEILQIIANVLLVLPSQN